MDKTKMSIFKDSIPKGFFWTDQVKTCKDINQAWEILDNEFANKRKLMDGLLAEINNLKQVKRDTKQSHLRVTQQRFPHM